MQPETTDAQDAPSAGPAGSRRPPSVDRLLAHGALQALIATHGRTQVLDATRALLAELRTQPARATAAAQRYAEEVQKNLRIEIVPVKTPREAVSGCDIVVTAGPILKVPHATIQAIEKGAAKEHIAAGTFALGGKLPVNTDGGLKAFGHPPGATGVRMIYENVLQLRGKAGPRQVQGARTALSHNIGVHPTACGIAILGKS